MDEESHKQTAAIIEKANRYVKLTRFFFVLLGIFLAMNSAVEFRAGFVK